MDQPQQILPVKDGNRMHDAPMRDFDAYVRKQLYKKILPRMLRESIGISNNCKCDCKAPAPKSTLKTCVCVQKRPHCLPYCRLSGVPKEDVTFARRHSYAVICILLPIYFFKSLSHPQQPPACATRMTCGSRVLSGKFCLLLALLLLHCPVVL